MFIYCACPCFANNNVEFISAYDILGTIRNDYTISIYEHYIITLESYGIFNVRQKLEHMLLLDFIVGNIDRHFNNFGVLRNSNTLEFIDVAPVFDTGSSLGSNKAAPFFHIDKNDEIYSFETDEFTQFHLIKNKYDLSTLKDITIWVKDFLTRTQYVYPEKVNKIVQFLNYRIKYIFQGGHTKEFPFLHDDNPPFLFFYCLVYPFFLVVIFCKICLSIPLRNRL